MLVMKNKKAVVLLSGGLDSTTTLYYVMKKGFRPYCLIFNYGQRHKKEISSAVRIAKELGIKYYVLKINLPWKGSSLLDKSAKLPEYKKNRKIIPSTYVPARNIIFLSIATSLAEVIGAEYIFYGANQIDFSGYPDCTKEFVNQFQKTIEVGTKVGKYGKKIKISAPLLNYTKEDILKLALKLKVPLHLTWSCYNGEKKPCGRCDACKIRQNAFKKLNIKDPVYGA